MTDLPYTYTDSDRARLVVSRTGRIEVTEVDDGDSDVVQAHAIVSAPTGADAVEFVRAVLAAAGDTEHRVVSQEELQGLVIHRAEQKGARSMQERAAAIPATIGTQDLNSMRVVYEQIRALPLLPDGEVAHSDGSQQPSETPNEQPAEEFDAGWAAGHAHASADEARIAELEKQVKDLSDLVHGHGEDIGNTAAATRGLGKLLREHVTATVDALKASREEGIADQVEKALDKVRVDFARRPYTAGEDG